MDLEKSLPLAEGMAEVEQAAKPEQPSAVCLNCNTPLSGPYCSECGQKDIPPRQTFGELMINFISSFWSFESKFFQTVRYILFKPGQLAIDYNAGRRERYFHPARMYVFISFIYFLLIGILPETGGNKTADADNSDINWTYDDKIGDYTNFRQYDSAQQALPEEKRDGMIVRSLRKRVADLNERYRDKKQFGADFSEHFSANTPRVFFLLLPIFALLLKLFYFRRDYFYSEHLVFSIYYYNLFFLAGSIYMVIELVPVVGHLKCLIAAWIGIYLLIAMKKAYRQSWGKTILKYGTFVLIFSFCILFGLVTNAIITFLII